MATTLEEINRKVKQEWLSGMTLEERLALVPTEEVLKRVSAEERLRGLPRRDLAKAFLRDELQREPTPDEIDTFLSRTKQK